MQDRRGIPDEVKCGNCFYMRRIGGVPNPRYTNINPLNVIKPMFCCRFPPLPTDQPKRIKYDEGTDFSNDESVFPVVRDKGWCGEFRDEKKGYP